MCRFAPISRASDTILLIASGGDRSYRLKVDVLTRGLGLAWFTDGDQPVPWQVFLVG